MRDDERGQTAGAQINQHEHEHPWNEGEEAEEEVSPIGDEGQHGMLRGPEQANHEGGNPRTPSESLQAREGIALEGDLLRRGRNDPPHGQAVGKCPDGEGVQLREVYGRGLGERTIEQSLSEDAAPEKERADEQKDTESDEEVATVTQTDGANEVAEPDAFAARKEPEAEEAADVDKGAVDVPPLAGTMHRSRAMQGKQEKSDEGLDREEQDRAGGYQQYRAGPRDAPGGYAGLDFFKGVCQGGDVAAGFDCVRHRRLPSASHRTPIAGEKAVTRRILPMGIAVAYLRAIRRGEGIGSNARSLCPRHQDHGCEAKEQDRLFDVLTAVVELVEVDAAGIVERRGVNGSAGGDAVSLHRRNDDELRVGGAGQHEHNENHGGHHRTRLVDAPSGGEGQERQYDDTGDHTHAMENAQQLAYDAARRVRIAHQGSEGDGGNDGKKDLRAQPDDEREIEQGAKQSFHQGKDTGTGIRGQLSGIIETVAGRFDCRLFFIGCFRRRRGGL